MIDNTYVKRKLRNWAWYDVKELLPVRSCEVIVITESGTVINCPYNKELTAFNSRPGDNGEHAFTNVRYWTYWEVL